MLSDLETLRQHSAVTGSESTFANFLCKSFIENGVRAERDRLGNVLVQITGSGVSKKRILICVPLDIPGFVALCKESDRVYLSSVGSISDRVTQNLSLLDETGFVFPLSKDDGEWYVNASHISIGDTLRPNLPLSETKEKVKGWMCSRFALIKLLQEICSLKPKNDIICSFTRGFEARTCRESNLAHEFSPDTVLLLGTAEISGVSPLIAIREGKFFSDTQETEKILKCKIKTREIAFADNLTKAEELSKEHTCSILSLALPCQNKGKTDESFGKRAYDNLLFLLKEYL